MYLQYYSNFTDIYPLFMKYTLDDRQDKKRKLNTYGIKNNNKKIVPVSVNFVKLKYSTIQKQNFHDYFIALKITRNVFNR